VFGYLLPGALFLTALSLGGSTASSRLQGLWSTGHWNNILFLAFLAYIGGTCIASLSSYGLERVVLRLGWLYPTARFFPNPDAVPMAIQFRKFMRTLKVVTWISPNYRQNYSTEMQLITAQTLKEIFGTELKDDHDRFWLSWEYITLHHPIAYRRATHFLELYGFSRNSAMSLFLVAFLPALGHSAWRCPINNWAWWGGSMFLGIVFFSNSTNVFRRMNNEVYRGLVAAWKAPVTGTGDDAEKAEA
jgi:hypothetical protein